MAVRKATSLAGPVFALMLCACMEFNPDSYRQQLMVPICKLECATAGGEDFEAVVWGEDESGRTICHTSPSAWSGSEAFDACKETQDEHCDFARIKQEQKMPGSTCAVDDSFWYSGCCILGESVLQRESLRDGSLFPNTIPEDIPECDVVFGYE